MPVKDLGQRHICFKCGTKFYDMKKPDPVCPKCGADQRENVVAKPSEGRRGRLSSTPKIIEPIPEPEEPEAAEEEEGAEFEDEDNEAVSEDEDEL